MPLTSWERFCQAIAETDVIPPNLVPFVLAQAILESGRGQTEVSQGALNFFSLKQRPEIYWACNPSYTYSAEPYLLFRREVDCVYGYWAFIHRYPYPDVDKHLTSGKDLHSYIGKSFCPPGYTDAWAKVHNGKNYHDFICEDLLPEALQILNGLGWKESRTEPAVISEVPGFSIVNDRLCFNDLPVQYEEAKGNYPTTRRLTTDSIILHGTGAFNPPGILDGWALPGRKVSAHLVAGLDGTFYQAVPLDFPAWHSGNYLVNNTSVSIEHENLGPFLYGTDCNQAFTRKVWVYNQVVPVKDCIFARGLNDEVFHMYPRYSQAQIDASATVSRLLVKRYGVKRIQQHENILTDKWDAGPAFPYDDYVKFVFSDSAPVGPSDTHTTVVVSAKTLEERVADLEADMAIVKKKLGIS